MKKVLIILVSILLCFSILSAIIYNYYDKTVNGDVIYPGISINGVDLSNMSKEEALKKVAASDTHKDDTVILLYGEEEYEIKYEDLGYNPDFTGLVEEAYKYGKNGSPMERFGTVMDLNVKPKNYKADESFKEKKVVESLESLAELINVEPKNAEFSLVDGQVHITPEQNGKVLDIEDAKGKIMKSMYKKEPIELVMKDVEAEIKSDYYDSLNGVIGEFSTNYTASIQNRKDNIKLAASLIDGKLLMPGEEFSFNDTVGHISAETGFLPATVISDGEFTTGTGGGICQVSTTLYNAVVKADLTVNERRNHSRPVNYVPVGTDAAVAEGFLDMKFVNSFDFPILIKAKADDDNVYFQIVGDTSKKNYEIELVSERTKVIESSTHKQNDNTLSKGQSNIVQTGNDGYNYISYKIKKVNGEEVAKEQYLNSYYPARDTIISIGTKEN